ncbi:hypothetical protein SDC9_187390 [bioreactor metagenome]|uniref:Uncharacterized protein n=1 Tax=bioreactor metagenome TaxID=1076179 RepID=A0A645HMR3_9ZZZZ
MTCCKSPFDTFPGQAFLDLGIVGQVIAIIIQHEIIEPHRPISNQDCQEQPQADQHGLMSSETVPHGRGSLRCALSGLG